MTIKQLMQAIGQNVYYNVDTMKILCTVQDVKLAWQKPLLQLVPVMGTGSKWVALTSVSAANNTSIVY